MNKPKNISVPNPNGLPDTSDLVADVRDLIEQARSAAAVTINTELTMLHWRVGKRISDEILRGGRAEYGKGILQSLSAKLSAEYGNGWSERSLVYMVRFAEIWPDSEILHTLCAKLSWSHFMRLILKVQGEIIGRGRNERPSRRRILPI